MENKARRKRIIKSGKEDDNCVNDELSTQRLTRTRKSASGVKKKKADEEQLKTDRKKVLKKADKNVVKGNVHSETSPAAEVAAANRKSNRSRECKHSLTKRKRASSSADSGPVQRQGDTELVHNTLPPRKRRKPVTSLQNDEPLMQEKRTHQLKNKRQLPVKKERLTWTRKSASGAKKKKADEEQLEPAVETVRKKSTKVKYKLELPPASSIKGADKTTIKMEKPDVACILPPQQSCRKFIGAHVSISGGLWNAVLSTLEIGGSALGLFLRSQRTWHCKPLEDSDAELFKKTLKESGIDPWMVVPHGSYLLNCGSSDDEVLRKTRETLVDELKRCEKLGLPIYNFHPGSSKGEVSRQECIEKIAASINYVHSRTASVITVIENMSCQGNTIGGKFSELRQIIDLVKDKSRVGVCLDTCHAFAAGYDIRSEKGYEQMKAEFEEVVGRHNLKAVHLNDSKGGLGCHLDRHENIGRGKLGMCTFRRIMNDPFFNDLPLILETPEGDYKREIQSLYKQLER